MKKSRFILSVIAVASFSACNSFLDVTPPSTMSPSDYLTDETHLEAFTMNRYNSLSVFSIGADNNTDNQASNQAWTAYVPSNYLMPLESATWSTSGMSEIYQINYFLDTVVPRWKNGEITGTESRIKHFIGEMYFFRAYQYFSKLQALGDFPILDDAPNNDREQLSPSFMLSMFE